MIITQISEISKNRCKVYIDYEFAFVLYKGELHLYHLRENEEIEKEAYDTIMQEILPKRAKLRAMNLLKSRDYTEAKLREKLKQGDYPDHIIDIAIDYVASFHYIDDCRYAVSYITCYENGKSKQRINQDLFQKGITKETIKKAWDIWEEQGGRFDELSMIRKYLEKRKYDVNSSDYKEQQKTFGFLMRKGFSADLIKKAMNMDWID